MKQEFSSVRADIGSISDEIKSIHASLDEIHLELKNHSGYSKEIDHLLERVVAIEKYMGMRSQTPA